MFLALFKAEWGQVWQVRTPGNLKHQDFYTHSQAGLRACSDQEQVLQPESFPRWHTDTKLCPLPGSLSHTTQRPSADGEGQETLPGSTVSGRGVEVKMVCWMDVEETLWAQDILNWYKPEICWSMWLRPPRFKAEAGYHAGRGKDTDKDPL